MKLKTLMYALVLLLATGCALAQTQAPPPHPPSPDVPFMGNWNPPAALSSDWWNDPQVAADLRLTEAQKRQLEQVTTNLKLTLIDAGASALKSYVRLQSLLDSDTVDRATYNQELDAGANAAARLVRDLGQMALTVRTTLSAEQWHKLEAMKAAGTMEHRHGMEGEHMRGRPRSQPPDSLRTTPPE